MDPSSCDHTCGITRKYLSGETCRAAAGFQTLERLSGIQLHLCYSIEAEREPKAEEDPVCRAMRDSRSENDARKLKKQASQRTARRAEMPAMYWVRHAGDKPQQMTQHTARKRTKSNTKSRLNRRA